MRYRLIIWCTQFLALAVLVVGLSHPTFAGKGNVLVLDVLVDLSTFDVAPSESVAGQGAFYVFGDIRDPVTLDVIGDYQCWGYLFDGGGSTVVAQEYNLFGRGKIQVQGVEDPGF